VGRGCVGVDLSDEGAGNDGTMSNLPWSASLGRGQSDSFERTSTSFEERPGVHQAGIPGRSCAVVLTTQSTEARKLDGRNGGRCGLANPGPSLAGFDLS